MERYVVVTEKEQGIYDFQFMDSVSAALNRIGSLDPNESVYRVFRVNQDGIVKFMRVRFSGRLILEDEV